MKKYSIIYFRGKLNGEKVFRDLIIIEFPEEKKIPYMFNHKLSSYLYEKRGKTRELGQKNGPKSSGWLDATSLLHSPKLYPNCKIIKVHSFDIPEVYNIIKPHLKKAIDEKIKIKGKGR